MTSHLSMHPKNISEPKFACPICKGLFRRKTNLNKHLEIHSAVYKEINCEVCFKKMASIKTLRRHMQSIHGPRQFTCDTCRKEFTTSTSLQRHMRIHTYEKPFKCCFCKYESNVNGNLLKHVRNFHNRPDFCYKDILKESGVYEEPRDLMSESNWKRIKKNGEKILMEFETKLRNRGVPFLVKNFPRRNNLKKVSSIKQNQKGSVKKLNSDERPEIDHLSVDLGHSILPVYSNETIHYTLVPDEKGSIKLLTKDESCDSLPPVTSKSFITDKANTVVEPCSGSLWDVPLIKKNNDLEASIFGEQNFCNYPMISINDLEYNDDQCDGFDYNQSEELINQSLLSEFVNGLNSDGGKENSIQKCSLEKADSSIISNKDFKEIALAPGDSPNAIKSECIKVRNYSSSVSKKLTVEDQDMCIVDLIEDSPDINERTSVIHCSMNNDEKIISVSHTDLNSNMKLIYKQEFDENRARSISNLSASECNIYKIKTKRSSNLSKFRNNFVINDKQGNLRDLRCKSREKYMKDYEDSFYITSIEESELKRDPDVVICVGDQL